MKTLKYILLGTIVAAFGSCELYHVPTIAKPTSGKNLDFTKMVSVGNSLTSGYMNGALYTAGQNNSWPKILATQMALAGGGNFVQPDIGSVNGYYGTAPGPTILGRLYLKGLASPKPTPKIPGEAPTAYTGDKTLLNNFGVPGVTLGGALSPALSGNPYYARFASNPGTSTLIGDASTALANGGTFFTFWLGNNDVLGYATAGASAGGTLTSNANFTTYFNGALNLILAANADAEGVVGNIPDVTSIPFFNTVKYNPIPLDAPTAAYLTTNLANNYNAFLDGMVTNLIITQAEATKRYLTFTAGTTNKILINDETLTDLSPYMAGPYAGLAKYNIARQTASTDLVCLTAGSYIGAVIDKNPSPAPDSVLGVTFPLYNTTNPLKGDDLILIPTEITQIQTAVTDFNTIISTAVAANSSRLALLDAHQILLDLKASPAVVNGSNLTSSISPPFGAFSVDGVHPNARGYAYIANKFIEAINAKWGSTIPLCNPNDYPGNELPIP